MILPLKKKKKIRSGENEISVQRYATVRIKHSV